MRLLLIDDEAESIAALKEEATPLFEAIMHVDFAGAQRLIETFEPHLVVLDLMLGSGSEQKPEGLETFEYVWNTRFCPLVVYTGFPEALEGDSRTQHPFVKVVKKGKDSELEVVKNIREFESHLSALDRVHKEIRVVMNRALKEVAPLICREGVDIKTVGDVLTRTARRRVAAAMDEALSTSEDSPLTQWEHYLVPPIGKSLLTGDILRHAKSDPAKPESYVVVLTPSCDLEQGGGRAAKVDTILVARCEGMERLLKELPPNLKDVKVQAKMVRALLSQGHGKTCIPLPGFPNLFPAMVANFRRLALLEFSAVGISVEGESPTTDFIRVTSVDSPFREMVAWAYMLCAARPALPDRDFDSWLEEVLPNPTPAPAPAKTKPTS